MKVEYGKTGTYFYLVGLILMVVSLTTSRFALSLSLVYLLVLWFLLGLDMRSINRMYPEKPFLSRVLFRIGFSLKGIWCNVKTRFNDFLHNKIAVVIVSVYIMHLIGLIYTSDYQYAFKDLRIKLPLLVIPLVMSTMKPLSRKQFDTVLWFFIASVFFVTILGTIKFIRRDFVDVRELSPFINYIRLSLCIVFSIFILGYYLVKKNYSLMIKSIMVFLIIWFLWQITVFESITSILVVAALCFALMVYYVFKSTKTNVKICMVVVIVVVVSVVIYFPYKVARDYMNPAKVDAAQLDTYTKLGNPYVFDTIHFGVEDARYVGLYLSKNEMLEAWNKRSVKKINNEWDDGYRTLVRYLTSKDLRKDAEGVEQLTENDIRNVENGIANYNYIENPGFKTRIMRVMVGYDNYRRSGDANGSSVFQRVEYIKASFGIIKDNPIFGVGTGITKAFDEYYEDTNSKLRPEYRLRSHNQYLAITVAFGVLGLLWFLFSMFYPLVADKRNRNYLYIVFLFIILLSMFTDDTLETQVGATLFAFFNSFLIFCNELRTENLELEDFSLI